MKNLHSKPLSKKHKNNYEQTQRDLKEIDILIKQSAAEVERLAQRNAQSMSSIKQMETNFETWPREDIKERFEDLNDVHQRLYTMRGQLEKLQSDQRNLERLAEFQRRFIELSGFGTLPTPNRAGGGAETTKRDSGHSNGRSRAARACTQDA